MADKVYLRLLATGVPELDTILGRGLPERSFNVIGGPPASGKTTFAQQIMFGPGTPGRKALFFTAMDGLPVKMLRYQRQFSFFPTVARRGSMPHLAVFILDRPPMFTIEMNAHQHFWLF
ncbi:RAD55 family ATPase [Massilia jejuensis]|uniref:RAD55 family ATPase n=1 Tax=Massilia jejuensis TaxID=648894 RepID=A0ABW0PG92_9BURK